MTDYEIKVQNFRCLNAVAKKGETVFVGSSLCELFPISEMLQNVEPRIRVYNRGIGGDVTDGLLRRMDESIFALEPKKVFINIGTNDISSPGYMRERLLAQYRKILEQIKARLPETKIYVLSYYPVNRALPGADPEQVAAMFGARTNEELRAVNGELEALAAALGCTYIDVFDCLTDENGNLRAEYTIEGMHMYANGYAVVLERLLPYLLENI